ncbi:class I SAM-dependent methyltransferase [Streptomyces sp. URMC 123]|uniref:class I SAM-dependent methyltransferase n=1 Tax=Streptomyces sp. URMC 123 TaxID=3423403 RepID=UPI003F1A1D09
MSPAVGPAVASAVERLRRLGRTLRRAGYGAAFDRLRGVETTAFVTNGDHHGDRRVYQPTETWLTARVLPPREVGPDDVFVDVGSGKGRVVLFAVSRYRARRVIGVEVSEELHAIAVRNVGTLDPARRSRVELVRADVTAWAVPDDATVFHLFNPFIGDTFRAFLAAVLASQERNPRTVRLVYTTPVMHDEVVAAGFEVLRTRRKLTLYRRRPDGLPGPAAP